MEISLSLTLTLLKISLSHSFTLLEISLSLTLTLLEISLSHSFTLLKISLSHTHPRTKTVPAEFEKDDDSNHHIDFIAACANLRAEKYIQFNAIMASYGITTADRNTIKKIAGKIIPAISTTTAFVTGTISLELFKIECGLNGIEKYRSCFANLSMPMFCFTEPGPCSKFTFCKKEYSLWDHLVLKKSEDLQTIGDLVSKLEELIGGEVSMVTAGSVSLYIGFGLPVGLNSWRMMN